MAEDKDMVVISCRVSRSLYQALKGYAYANDEFPSDVVRAAIWRLITNNCQGDYAYGFIRMFQQFNAYNEYLKLNERTFDEFKKKMEDIENV